jgi:hypothetical protein
MELLQIENCKSQIANLRKTEDARTVRAFDKERLQRGFASDQLPHGAHRSVQNLTHLQRF